MRGEHLVELGALVFHRLNIMTRMSVRSDEVNEVGLINGTTLATCLCVSRDTVIELLINANENFMNYYFVLSAIVLIKEHSRRIRWNFLH